MKDSKLIEVLKTLDTGELKEFKKFLESNGYKKSSQVYTFLVYLAKLAPDFPPPKIDKVFVSQRLLKEKSDNTKKISAIMTKLYSVLEEFVILEQLKKNQVAKNFLFLEALQDRKLDKMFFQKSENLEKEWQKGDLAGIEFLYHKYRLTKMYQRHPNFKDDPAYYGQKLNDDLDQFFFTERLYNALCFNLNTSSFAKPSSEESERDVINSILEIIQTQSENKISQIKILFQILYDNYENELENYHSIRDEFYNNRNNFNQYEQWDIVNFLEHYCIQNYRNGKTEYLREIFDLRVFSVETGIIIENGYIDKDVFRQIVLYGCSVKELEWIDQFISNYSQYLKKEVKANTTNYCEALILFHRKNFEAVLDKLMQVKFDQPLYTIQARCLLIQAYFELEGYEELLMNATRSLDVYLKRNAVLDPNFKKAYQNFARFTRNLFQTQLDPNGDISEIGKVIQEEKIVSHKLWLLEKLENLQKKTAK